MILISRKVEATLNSRKEIKLRIKGPLNREFTGNDPLGDPVYDS